MICKNPENSPGKTWIHGIHFRVHMRAHAGTAMASITRIAEAPFGE
jgi:hypothetical protein